MGTAVGVVGASRTGRQDDGATGTDVAAGAHGPNCYGSGGSIGAPGTARGPSSAQAGFVGRMDGALQVSPLRLGGRVRTRHSQARGRVVCGVLGLTVRAIILTDAREATAAVGTR